MSEPAFAIRAERLIKRYGETLAVGGVDLAIPRSQFFGLLGPNGAGKTSIIHMLSTLIRPTSGQAWVAGYSVAEQKVAVRRSIGVVFQEQALDRTLTVAENLRFAGLLSNLSRSQIKRRSSDLLELFGMQEKRDLPVGSLSGGMRRALDIARGVIHQPQILFLDEPTIGLDLPNRRAIWRHIARLRVELGITVFLTTHYLEEAIDCDEVAFLSAGDLVCKGPPRTLVEQLGRHIVEVETDQPAQLAERLAPRLGEALIEGDCVHFRCNAEPADLLSLQVELASNVRAMRWRRPNLNDVFLWVNRTASPLKKAA